MSDPDEVGMWAAFIAVPIAFALTLILLSRRRQLPDQQSGFIKKSLAAFHFGWTFGWLSIAIGLPIIFIWTIWTYPYQ